VELSGSESDGSYHVEAKDLLLALLHENHGPLALLQTCVQLGKKCNEEGRDELARQGMLSCFATVLNESISSLASVDLSSDDRGTYEELVKFVMEMMHHFARGSSLCIRKLLQYDVFHACLSTLDYRIAALYSESGMLDYLLALGLSSQPVLL